MLHVLLVVARREVVAHVTAAALLAVARRHDDDLGDVEQEPELHRLEKIGVEPLALVVDVDVLVALAQFLDDVEDLTERLLGAEDLGLAVHLVLQLLAQHGDPLGARVGAKALDELADLLRGVFRQRDELGRLDVLDRIPARALAEDVDVQERVGAEAVRAVHRYARALAGRVQAGHDRRVVAEHLRVVVGGDAAHRVVRRGHDGHGLDDGVDAEVGPRELRDVGELRLEHLRAQVRAVQEHVVAVGAGAATFRDLLHHATAHDVARREVFDRGGVPLHESLAGDVAKDRTLSARALGEEDAETCKARRVELEELHVLERKALAPDDADAVAGQRVGVRRRLEDLAESARREDDGLRVEDVQVARREVVGDDTGDLGRPVVLLHGDEVEHVVLVEEVDAELDAVLEERLQDHVPRAVGGVAGTADGGLAVVGGVAAEPTLVDLAFGRAVERQAHVLEVDDGVDRLFREDLRGILVDEVVAALDGVERVPLPRVLFDVRERCGHPALSGARVRARGVQLRDDGGAGARARLDRGAHTGAACAHDHDVELVVVDAVLDVAVGRLGAHRWIASVVSMRRGRMPRLSWPRTSRSASRSSSSRSRCRGRR